MKIIKEQQIEEAQCSLEGLKRTKESTTLRRDHYEQLLSEFMNLEEVASIGLSGASLLLQISQFGLTWGASAASLLPDIKTGFVTTLGGTIGGTNAGNASNRAASAIGLLSSILSSTGGMISTIGGYRRRAQDWQLQIDLASKELEGIEKQITAAEIRVAIAESDLENQQLQIENSQETLEFMQQKFSNQELYDWMVTQTSTLYFQSYQLAYDMTRKAERCYAFELGIETPEIIQYGYWDNLKKGLLAGDYLHHDLKRLEVAYLEQNKREYEVTKHISLRQLDPIALLKLREKGECFISVPETLFDLDYPGHYMRRIKSVSLSIPCVIGSYTSVSSTLTLTQSKVRRNSSTKENYADEANYTIDFISTQSIATSRAQSDSGLFELNFRDERYLPFEYAGVISEWKVELPKEFRQFDYNTITDVIIHMNYTFKYYIRTVSQLMSQNISLTNFKRL